MGSSRSSLNTKRKKLSAMLERRSAPPLHSNHCLSLQGWDAPRPTSLLSAVEVLHLSGKRIPFTSEVKRRQVMPTERGESGDNILYKSQ